MELLILNQNFEEMGRVDVFSSLQWIEKYYDVGNYELHCSTDYFNLLDNGTYLYRPDTKRLALLDLIEYVCDIAGSKTIKISGRLIESILNDRVVYLETTLNGTHEDIARSLVDKIMIKDTARKIPNLNLDSKNYLGIKTTLKIEGESVGDSLYKFLQEQDLSQRINYDYQNNKLYYEVWKGLDRTDNQLVNDWVIFSDENERIKNFNYSRDRSKTKNYAYVIGDGEGTDVKVVVVDQTYGGSRFELFVSGTKSRKKDDDSEMSELEYTELLKQEGLSALAETQIEEVFNGEADITKSVYHLDYELGDVCTCILNDVSKISYRQITEVKEIYEDGNLLIEPVFGRDEDIITMILKRKG